MAAAKTLSPAQLTERARKAAHARSTPDAHIKALVEKAPPLTPDQIDALRGLLAREEARAVA